MTVSQRTPWPTALIIAVAAALLMYGVLFAEPAASVAAMIVSLLTVAAMRMGWLPTRHQR
jgi:membrane protein YdbS with pleckstrin-like domain